MKAKPIAKNALLVFVLVSIGFALGKEWTLRSMRTTSAGAAPVAATGEDKVLVYYVHGAIRCVTCNGIEKVARETLEKQFAQELESERVVWSTVDYQNDEPFANRYDITSGTVVLVKLEEGKEARFKKLDEVWTLASDPAALSAFIAGEVRSFLETGGGGR